MSGIIRVTPEELVGMADRYSSEGSQVGDQISRLDNMIQELETMWEGQSSRAFSEQYQSLRPSFVDMQQLLEEISSQLKSTAKALEDADAQIANQIRG
ncbi:MULTISPECIES: WXG100 family type VII secretion target [Niallia]|jgi:WXG100 family type VII secretion target|uniref:ESAT-6-like protein n=1 Tax=Niallia circulans TaxID=1397 RepID=A0A268FBM0_NIACI|nr:WXG100 family type VII secretion target [Niallia circulans]AYV69411.1 WXG100 family type VII secretion target [Niallia circulans]AYV72204.1 WXG100 family type VII secretion target [Niallia circulans]MCM2981622.1 WXG100 family type VII secretion target [Niallia circulans]NRG29377.1 WXG100 family type VII secretion target [Niallia circulans]PAD82771.1 WXG100 family type VII secretion target [Niallia circulans]